MEALNQHAVNGEGLIPPAAGEFLSADRLTTAHVDLSVRHFALVSGMFAS